MDRVRRLSETVLKDNRERFGDDFEGNKKILEDLCIIRSKELKNEIAGFITRSVKSQAREAAEKARREEQYREQLEKEAQKAAGEVAEPEGAEAGDIPEPQG